MAKSDVSSFELYAPFRVPRRLDLESPIYDERISRYSSDYVNPTSWRIHATAYNGLVRYMSEALPALVAVPIDPGEEREPGLLDPGNPEQPVLVPDEIVAYVWLINSANGNFEQEKTVDSFDNFGRRAWTVSQCDFDVPELGRYDVILTVRFADGSVESSPPSRIELRDFLVVCIGDSFASGEGAPDIPGIPAAITNVDVPGLPFSLPDVLCLMTLLGQEVWEQPPEWLELLLASFLIPPWAMERQPVWQEPSAHRSLVNCYSSVAARIAENNRRRPGDTITYLNFARSGSAITRGLVEPKDDKIDVGQLEEIIRAIGNRRVDALIMSIGINNIQFEDVLANSVFNQSLLDGRPDNTLRTTLALAMAAGDVAGVGRDRVVADVERRLTELPVLYAGLDGFLEPLNPRRVYLVEYPNTVFENRNAQGIASVDRGCGVFSLAPELEIDLDDAEALTDLGNQLNETMRQAAEDHNWTYIGGITEVFEGRGYCAGEERYFVTLQDSCRTQGDYMGMCHPNVEGHRAVGEIVANTLARDLFGSGLSINSTSLGSNLQGLTDASNPTA